MVTRAMSPYYVSWMTGILSLVLGLDRVLHGLNGSPGWVECYLASVTIDWLCAICDSVRDTRFRLAAVLLVNSHFLRRERLRYSFVRGSIIPFQRTVV